MGWIRSPRWQRWVVAIYFGIGLSALRTFPYLFLRTYPPMA